MTERTVLLDLTTPLGDAGLRLGTMSVTEELGRLFDIGLSVLSEKNDIDPNKLLGKSVTITLELGDRKKRFFNGLVTSMGLEGASGRFFSYGVVLRPWLWMLSRRANTRIFQNKTVPEILEDIFQPYSTDFEKKLTGSYAKVEYCVQYRETDFNFVSRLMEHEGIYYFFKHTEGRHTLVLADKATVHVPVAGFETFQFRPHATQAVGEQVISEWRFSQEIQSGKVSLTDYDFVSPSTSLLVSADQARSHDAAKFEIYDQPGDYLTKGAGERYAQLRIEEQQARHNQASGYGTLTAMATGSRFTLAEHPRKDQNREHIVVSTRIHARNAGHESGSQDTDGYTCQFAALDSREVFRPQRLTPKPVVAGPQTALVVGPSGEEIHTDKHGRIKVQFHWDRLGKKDADSSCWMRVSQPWAGKGWGMLSLPRIGQEVVVEFLEGDPDRPLVTGSVYNGENLTPYALPDYATVSTVKSRSSKTGNSANFNELRFEDKKGEEYVWFQAEKDHFHLVKNDVNQSIGRDELVTVVRNRSEKIGGQIHQSVEKDVTQKIGGTVNLDVGTDILIKTDGQHSLKAGKDVSTESGTTISLKASQDVHVKAGMNGAFEAGMNLHLKGGMNVVVEAGVTLTLKAGPSNVVIGPSGVSITGPMVLINSGGGPGSGGGANPVAPTAPQKPEDPAAIKDPLPSR